MARGSAHTNDAQPHLRGVPMADVSPHGTHESRLCQVPLRLVIFGVSMFMIGAVLLIVWADDLAHPGAYGSFHALGLTHIFALGFVTSMVIAVLFQFIPASFHANVRGLRRTQVMTATYGAAVVVFAASLTTGAVVLAAIAGPLLAIAVGLFLSQMASVVIRAKRRSIEGGFHITAFLALTAVIVMGSLLATSLPTGWIHDPSRWLAAKIVVAVAGWLGMIMVGVSYHTVRGLNGSSAHPRLVLPTLLCAITGVVGGPVLILVDAPMPLRASVMGLLVISSCLFCIDVVHVVHRRARTAIAYTWIGQLIAVVLLVIVAIEGVLAMVGGVVWAAMAVSGFLLGTAPMAILANGNRIIPVLIANRYNGRGREPLNRSRFGRLAMPAAIACLLLSWLALQAGILGGSVGAIRIGGVALAAAAACMATTTVRQGIRARHDATSPRWTADR